MGGCLSHTAIICSTNCLSNHNHMSSEFWLMVLIFLWHSCNTWNSSEPSLLCLTLSLQGHKFKARSRRLKNIFIFIYNSSETSFQLLPERERERGEKMCLDPSESLVSVATSGSSLTQLRSWRCCRLISDLRHPHKKDPRPWPVFTASGKEINNYHCWLFLWRDDAFELSLQDREDASIKIKIIII